MSIEDDLAELGLADEQPVSPRTIKRPPNPIATWLTAESPPSNPWFTAHQMDNLMLPPHPESLAKRQRLLEATMPVASHRRSAPLAPHALAPHAPTHSSPPMNRLSSPIQSPMHSPISPIRNRLFCTRQPSRDDIAEPRALIPSAALTVQHGFPLSAARSPPATAMGSPPSSSSPISTASSCFNHALHLGEQPAPLSAGSNGALLLPPSLPGGDDAGGDARRAAHGQARGPMVMALTAIITAQSSR
mmetsp:Transcript_9982/g.26596  ORF Transcript_9982/g.26596 Transcript_9982/m.26596 type:complete len:246 (+) Transcript_9982:121-858(+)